MGEKQKDNLPLSPYRVLDLTDEKGLLCGKVLADLGAEVIKIEKPGGDPARSIGPFLGDIPHSENSLYWMAYNASKKGITLNIESNDGQEIFRELVKTADIIIESYDPGYLEGIGLGYAELSELNPALLMTSITPFGQTGPYSHYKASDLVLWSMGGYTDLCGDPDRPPVQISYPQAYFQAGMEAATATMLALYHQIMSGEGQYIDVSIQASVAKGTVNAPLFWEINKIILKRSGPDRVGLSKGGGSRTHWPCKDGYIAFSIFGGPAGARTNKAIAEYMESEGVCPEFMREMDWINFDLATISQELFDRFADHLYKFFMSHTKQELFEEAVKRKMTIYPVTTIEDIAKNPHLAERGFWQKIEHADQNTTLTYPGDFCKSTEPLFQKQHAAPKVGEHNLEIFEKLMNFTRQDIILWAENGVI